MLINKIKLKKLDLKNSLKDFYLKESDRLRDKHKRRNKKHGSSFGISLAKKRSKFIDQLIGRTIDGFNFKDLNGVSIVALGGYGREQLSPYSDVDLLFLYNSKNKKLAKEVAESLLYCLWDLGFDVGHSVRTVNECISLSKEDDTMILTSLLDSRFILGDLDLYNKLESSIFDKLLPKISAKFISKKIAESETRKKRFGGSVYLLEPNVKEGEGGLRDIQTALWVAQAKYKIKNFEELLSKGFINQKHYRVLNRCLNFLLSVRAELHYLAERREDRISFEFQERIANFFGYKDLDLRAVERFMRVYYLRASLTKQQSERIIDSCIPQKKSWFKRNKTVKLDHGFIIQNGKLSVESRDIFKRNPVNLMRAFEYSNRGDVEMSRYLTWIIRENAIYIDDKLRKNGEFNTIFLRLLRHGKNISETLLLMNELRVLAHYIPEFGKIVCLVQHDAYHVYTVDVHSIFMVREIESLLNYEYEKRFPLLTKLAESVVKKHILYLACLFHDAGKGSGKNHSEKGAKMIPAIAKRMSLTDDEKEQLEFLVRYHLIMPHFSQRRDLHDMSLIERFAELVKSDETLTLLYLLTFADIRSVGPEVWSDWKGMLLRELYLKTSKFLELGEYTKDSLEERREQIILKISRSLRDKVTEKQIRTILAKMPESYLLGHSPKSIANHVKIINSAENKVTTDLIHYPGEQHDELVFWGYDEEGIFSKLCGVVSASGLNILGARITTTDSGNVLDVFYVNKLGESTTDQGNFLEKVTCSLKKVVEGKLDVEDLVNKQKDQTTYYKKIIPKYPPRIEVDNRSSEIATVVDVYAHDRPGLLYDMTKTIAKLGLSVVYAKIATKVDQVVDIFYIQDKKGKKVTAEKKLEKIKASMMDSINNP